MAGIIYSEATRHRENIEKVEKKVQRSNRLDLVDDSLREDLDSMKSR